MFVFVCVKIQIKQKGCQYPSGGEVWGRRTSVSSAQTNTPFVVFLARATSSDGNGIHLVHLVLEPNVFQASVVK